MTDKQIIAAAVKAAQTPGFAGDLLRALAVDKRDRAYHAEALASSPDAPLNFQHQALGCLLAQEYADRDAYTIAQVAGAAFEDGNYHPEAAAVREMGFAPVDTLMVEG